MTDEEGQSDKLVCVPRNDPAWDDVVDLGSMPSQLRSEIEHFYSIYKQPEGKDVDVQGWDDRTAAAEAIDSARRRYQEEHP
jgi:inorganic pyrophosphatase